MIGVKSHHSLRSFPYSKGGTLTELGHQWAGIGWGWGGVGSGIWEFYRLYLLGHTQLQARPEDRAFPWGEEHMVNTL